MGKGADQPEVRHRKWSAEELMELGDLLRREISIQEIARLLRRNLDDVENKVVEEGERAVSWFVRALSLRMPEAARSARVCRGAAGDRRRDGAGNLKPQDRVPTLTPVRWRSA
jgi:hypothetical protein